MPTPALSSPPQSSRPSGEAVLKQAMKNPGVRDLMKVYQHWQRLESAVKPIRDAMAPRLVTWVTDSATSKR